MTEPDTRQAMSQTAQHIVTEHFSLQQMIDGNHAVYQQVLAARQ
jgi:hypothetical protein